MPPDGSSKLSQALGGLYARVPLGMRLGLDAMRAACAVEGAPEGSFDAVHVAGTNGKGSVSAMVERIVRESGRRTGLYTSPHLCRFAERIRVNGEPISDALLADMLLHVLGRHPDLSFFEVATLTAFLSFREAGVELAVIEVGIGGRLDATNVLPKPRVAAITRIAFDHTDKLGTTLEAIAREKAGIAKPGVPIILGPMSDSVRLAIDDVAWRAGATVHSAAASPMALPYAAVGWGKIGLAGEHQRENAAVAAAVGQRLGVRRRDIEEGIASATWPGRLEMIETRAGRVLFDAAHNPDGASSLARFLGSQDPPERIALVFGTLADKDWRPMLDILAPFSHHRLYVAPKGRAPTPPTEMAARHEGGVAGTIAEAFEAARVAVGPDGLVVVCGSIYLVGEARGVLLGLPIDPPVAL